jgi:hypothetical protein
VGRETKRGGHALLLLLVVVPVIKAEVGAEGRRVDALRLALLGGELVERLDLGLGQVDRLEIGGDPLLRDRLGQDDDAPGNLVRDEHLGRVAALGVGNLLDVDVAKQGRVWSMRRRVRRLAERPLMRTSKERRRTG